MFDSDEISERLDVYKRQVLIMAVSQEIQVQTQVWQKKQIHLEFQIVQDLTTVHTAYLMLQSLQDRAATAVSYTHLEDERYRIYEKTYAAASDESYNDQFDAADTDGLCYLRGS